MVYFELSSRSSNSKRYSSCRIVSPATLAKPSSSRSRSRCGTSGSTVIAEPGDVTYRLTQPDNTTPLSAGTYTDCIITATNDLGTVSEPLTINGTDGFTVSDAPINDTGIQTCGNYAFTDEGDDTGNNNNLDCSATSDNNGNTIPYGQDGQQGRDTIDSENDGNNGNLGFHFTKIDSNGDALPEDATTWDCIRDDITGLMWEVKTDDDTLRDKDWTYSLRNTNASTNGGDSGTSNGGTCENETDCDTETYVANINALSLCGASDWRMPSRLELINLIDHGTQAPLIDDTFFPNTHLGDYWSSTPFYIPSSAWVVNFTGGTVTFEQTSSANSIRVVRDVP